MSRSPWSDIINAGNTYTEGDTTYVTEVEIVFGSFDERPNSEYVGTRGTGTVPERTNSSGRWNISPLLAKKNRSWTPFWPYDYDMPVVRAGWQDPYASGAGVCMLSEMSVCIALMMDHYRYPDPAFWDRQPQIQGVAQSTELTRFNKQLMYDLGFQNTGTLIGLYSSNLFSTIPNILRSKYNYRTQGFTKYKADPAAVQEIYQSIFCGTPVIYQTNIPDGNTIVELKLTHIIDGYQEIYEKVVKYKYVLGIRVGSTTTWYYHDYFHFVSGVGRSYSKWDMYDYMTTTTKGYSDYVMFLFPNEIISW